MSPAIRAVVLVLGASVLLWAAVRIAGLAHDARANGLRADALEAQLDTSRTAFGVTLRRAVQSELEADSLSLALKSRPILHAPIEVRRDTIRLVDTVVVTEAASGAREATFARQGDGWDASGSVSLPTPPAQGVVRLTVALAPIPLVAGLVCGAPVGGIRPASITVSGPTWTRLQLGASQVTPEACNPQRVLVTVRKPGWLVPLAAGLGLLGGLLIH